MKHITVVGQTLRKNSSFLLAMLVTCGLIPHMMLSLLQLASRSEHWSPAEVEQYANLFVCQWIPFWLVFLAYLRMQKTDHCYAMSVLLGFLLVLTYLPRFAQRSVMTVALTVPLMLAAELSGLMKNAEASQKKFPAALAADRGILRAFWFWSLIFPLVILISCEACTFSTTVISPFQMLPIPGVLLFSVFRHQKDSPPSGYTACTMLASVPLSLFLVTVGPMKKFAVYHLIITGLGYVLLFLMLIVYNMDHWKKAD